MSSDIIALTHALSAETVTGSPTTIGTQFTGSKYPEETIDEKEEGEDE